MVIAKYTHQKILLPTAKKVVPFMKATYQKVIVPLSRRSFNVGKIFLWRLPLAIYSENVLPMVGVAKKIANFYGLSLPKAVSTEVVPKLSHSGSAVGRFYSLRFPKAIYTEIAVPSAPVVRDMCKFYALDLPLATGREAKPAARAASDIFIRCYLRKLPVEVGKEIMVPTLSACAKTSYFYGNKFPRALGTEYIVPSLRFQRNMAIFYGYKFPREIFGIFAEPMVNIFTFYVKLGQQLLPSLLRVLSFYGVELPMEIWNVLLWLAKTLRDATLWMYEKILSPVGWRLYEFTRAAIDRTKIFGSWFWVALFLPLIKIFKQFTELLKRMGVTVKEIVVPLAKTAWTTGKDIALMMREFVQGFVRALVDFFTSIKARFDS
jgi:hypothetical protein